MKFCFLFLVFISLFRRIRFICDEPRARAFKIYFQSSFAHSHTKQRRNLNGMLHVQDLFVLKPLSFDFLLILQFFFSWIFECEYSRITAFCCVLCTVCGCFQNRNRWFCGRKTFLLEKQFSVKNLHCTQQQQLTCFYSLNK